MSVHGHEPVTDRGCVQGVVEGRGRHRSSCPHCVRMKEGGRDGLHLTGCTGIFYRVLKGFLTPIGLPGTLTLRVCWLLQWFL